ncbi:MAG: hypothetical protein J6J39_06840 [Clostridia bacterium]|nr:hypothetical protein [Clostridia bacterium]
MQKISLNGFWDARIDPEENGLAQAWFKEPIKPDFKVKVPGCIQQLDNLVEEYPQHMTMRNSYEGTYFLETNFETPELSKGERCRLKIGGAGPSCHIYINGEYAAKSIYALNNINVDITSFIKKGSNRLTVVITEQYASLISGMRFAGMNWSGIHSEAFVEIGGTLEFKDTYIAQSGGKAVFEGVLINSDTADYKGKICVDISGKKAESEVSLKAGESIEISIPVNVVDLPRWSYRAPNLVEVKATVIDNNGVVITNEFKTGLREIKAEGDKILIDGNPTFFKGTGSEYYSPTIAPLTDSEIIRKRFNALRDYGFNFFRCHTHVPTEEELCIADEMGIMLDVEFGLVSNFNKTTPIEKGMEMWEKFIRQSRKHPSIAVYCIGNEGSQLMVDSLIECNRAKMGYNIIKENTQNQLGIIAFGMQGELPELPNDFETPHLWSDNFLWAYDGLTDIPWEDLGRTTGGKPCVIHEYGKFGVWPSRKEEKDCTVPYGIKSDHGTQSYNWLKENGIEDREEALLKNSRRSASDYNRILLEQARFMPYVSGYALWTFYRRSSCNAGLCDDLGGNYNCNPDIFKEGVNADVAVLMDRGFLNRSFPCEIEQSIAIALSNFGICDVNGSMCVKLVLGDTVIAQQSVDCDAQMGVTKKVLDFKFKAPSLLGGNKVCLKAEFKCECGKTFKNEWDFWCFDTSPDNEAKIYLHIEDMATFRGIKKTFPNAQRLSSVDSVIIGCRSWRDPKLAETASKTPDILIISDQYDEVTKSCIDKGCKVLIVDGGYLPDNWMLPPIREELGERDPGRFFCSFRAGWSLGNLVTNINADKILGKFPHENFCDLHFYDLMQSARIMKPEIIEEVFGNKVKAVVESFSKMPVVNEAQSIVQDPNAIKEQKNVAVKTFNARQQGYLLKINDRVAVTTMKLHDNASGIGLLKEIIKNI